MLSFLGTLPLFYRSLYGRATLFVVGVCLALIGLDIRQTWTARDVRLHEARTETENLTRSLARHAQDVFETTDALLKTLADSIVVADGDPAAIGRVDRWLHVRVSVQPLLHGVAVFDERGNWLATSLAATDFGKVRTLNYAERDFFRYHRDHADEGALISAPIRSKLDGAWVVSMTRRLNHPDGSFAGVSQAAISLDLFQRFFEPFDIGEKGTITLASAQGEIIVRRPFDQSNVGRSVAQAPLFQQIEDQKEAGSIAYTALIDATPRLGSFHRVAGFNLVVIVALAQDEVLADWWHETKVHLAWLAATILFVAILGHRVAMQMRDRVAAEATTQKLQLEFDLLGVVEAEHAAHDRALESANAALTLLSTDLTKARDVADRANRAKSRFLAGMTHELRTPLNGILGYAHLLHLEGGLNATQDGRVNAMLEAGKHLRELITCVLDLSEIENEHTGLQSIQFDVLAVVTACLDLVRPTAESNGLALGLAAAPDMPVELFADPTRLRQILLNLLGNAVKFTTQGSVELRVLRSVSGSALRFEVADTGPGISANDRQHLFQDFERLDTEITRTVEGAGLGLAISNRLAKLMGGSLCHDDNPGGGSVFWLELPLDSGAPAVPAIVPAAEPALLPARSLHVLVVDDIRMNRDIASSFLRMSGHEVTSVEGGAEAVAAVAATAFDVVLMDVRMPEMDGLEATRRIRAHEGTGRRVPIIALTAQAFSEQVAECETAGMDSHLVKPFDPETLLTAVMRAAGAGPAPAQRRDAVPPMRAAGPVAADPVIGLELRVCDLEAFERTAGYLTPVAVADYLRTVANNAEDLLRALHEPDALTRQAEWLAEAAHMLTGSAGMFGFDRLAELGRRFERAVESGASDAAALSQGLAAAIEVSLPSIRSHLLAPVEG